MRSRGQEDASITIISDAALAGRSTAWHILAYISRRALSCHFMFSFSCCASRRRLRHAFSPAASRRDASSFRARERRPLIDDKMRDDFARDDDEYEAGGGGLAAADFAMRMTMLRAT